jgi:hypothetical protein
MDMETKRSQRQRVYDHLAELYPEGATDDEMEVTLGLTHQTLSARRWELCKDGQVVPTSRKRKTRSGGRATVWQVSRS